MPLVRASRTEKPRPCGRDGRAGAGVRTRDAWNAREQTAAAEQCPTSRAARPRASSVPRSRAARAVAHGRAGAGVRTRTRNARSRRQQPTVSYEPCRSASRLVRTGRSRAAVRSRTVARGRVFGRGRVNAGADGSSRTVSYEPCRSASRLVRTEKPRGRAVRSRVLLSHCVHLAWCPFRDGLWWCADRNGVVVGGWSRGVFVTFSILLFELRTPIILSESFLLSFLKIFISLFNSLLRETPFSLT